jgi:hypothetical protein
VLRLIAALVKINKQTEASWHGGSHLSVCCPAMLRAIPTKSEAPSKGGLGTSGAGLAVSGDGAYFAGQEMIRRPGTGHDHLAIF